ncbi:sulfite exporter TauE/SafE family protein, partial [Rhizobium ruizarguesonis]
NALAGGGSFLSLPALISVGVPSVAANATSTLALFPGGMAISWVYRDGVKSVCGVNVANSKSHGRIPSKILDGVSSNR